MLVAGVNFSPHTMICVCLRVCAALSLHAFNTLSLSDSLQGPAEDLQQCWDTSLHCVSFLSPVYSPIPPLLSSNLSFSHSHPIPFFFSPLPLAGSPSPALLPAIGVSVLFWWCVITGGSFTGERRDETDENTACRPSELLTGWKWMSQR